MVSTRYRYIATTASTAFVTPHPDYPAIANLLQPLGSPEPLPSHKTMLSGRVAIVTGSSAGIGAAIAKELSDRGATVIINYPFPTLKSEADAVLATLSLGCIAVEADLSTITGPAALIAEATRKFGKIDILVNNASIAINKSLENLTLEDWDRMVNLNGRGYFLTTQAVLPHLNNPSRIINIVSASSRGPPPTQTIYLGTKGMQDSFTKVWAQELPRKYGCTVNAVSPGPVWYSQIAYK